MSDIEKDGISQSKRSYASGTKAKAMTPGTRNSNAKNINFGNKPPAPEFRGTK